MQKKSALLLMTFFAALQAATAQQGMPRQECYQVGEKIDPAVSFVAANGAPVRLLDLVEPDTKLIYLLIFGGPSLNPEHSEGGLWCEDSFNDLPTSNFIARKFGNSGVKVVPVVCPPVYHERRFGYEPGLFMETAPTERAYQQNFQTFVDATGELQEPKIIPFDTVYYDPQFRLLFNFSAMRDLSDYAGEPAGWLGKFKPCGDSQRYSTPTIWLLSPDGEVLREPFYGNRFLINKLEISYTIRDVDAAVAELLGEGG